MVYRISLPPTLSNLHNMFHVYQLKRYILDPSHVIQVDNVQVIDSLVMEASPMQIEGHEVKKLHGKDIALVKIVCGGLAGGSVTWELEGQMRESYLTLFLSENFRVKKLFKWQRVITPRNLIKLFNQIISFFLIN